MEENCVYTMDTLDPDTHMLFHFINQTYFSNIPKETMEDLFSYLGASLESQNLLSV
ncbi:hypothetical protein [Clostridium lacusfryxellense]|uniref:hypothetical protein n=1 Tax=Clostridium lacusfryxellense TaxID=205328 RepID=UPI001C0E2016|nr:hypothetical protein [Clostridium lacusfryxellense]MBU3113263.1 hypothetical protein [Clostridium lacusfryxellense]